MVAYTGILGTVQITKQKLLHFELSKSGQIVCADKTCFPRLGHIYCLLFVVKNLRCSTSLPSFLKKHSWLPAFVSFHSIHMQKFARMFAVVK